MKILSKNFIALAENRERVVAATIIKLIMPADEWGTISVITLIAAFQGQLELRETAVMSNEICHYHLSHRMMELP